VCIVIGIGNPDRGDDGAGHAVAKLLRESLPAGIEVVEEDGEATALLGRMEGAAAVYMVDACVSGDASGTVHRFDVHDAPLPYGKSGPSTHGFGLAEAVELGRALGQLPRRCIVYAIEGASFEAGAPLTPPVAAAVAEVARRLRDEITVAQRETEDA
jgi:hydrogenase maturation protease